jgi:murein DD-endopeptidase MepM/ murein hydrolase activator NlpD
MARRLLLLLTLGLVLSAPALAGDNYGQQKASLDAKLAAVQAKIAAAHQRESQLNTQIGGLTTEIHTLEARVGDVSSKLSALQADVALHQRRLDKLNELYSLQTLRFHDLRREYALAVQRLDQRLVDIYEQNNPTTIDVVLAAKSFQDVLDQLNYLNLIAAQDKHIATEVRTAKQQVRSARAKTAVARQGVQHEQWLIAARAQQQAILRGQLLTSQNRLVGARAGKAHALLATKAQEQAAVRESQAIEAASAQLTAKIQASERSSTSGGSSTDTTATPATPSAAGLIWPVSGPITSPFGPRWGGFHPGIDIGVPEGTPIEAAAAGTVIWCGWESGYGNLVVIDHHNGLATAYGHQSRIVASCGEDVAQGQVIGYSGCTGFCTGPHLHFEVRVNGNPVDPLGYLP